jgi:Sulfotransferase family
MSVQHRVFLVGCARGGTTILQSCVAAHSRLFTFPESRLMRSCVADRPWPRRIGLATSTARERLLPAYTEMGFDPARCRRHLWLRGYVRDFAACADEACLAVGRDIWLEKTPDHVRHVDDLARWVPRARFLHILRNGFDNVCALLDVASKHPAWGRMTLQSALERWRTDARISLACADRDNHCVVRLADLVAAPEPTLRAVDRFLGLAFEPAQCLGVDPTDVATTQEPWKAGVGGGVRRADPDRYRDLLPKEQQAWLRAEVAAEQARIDALPAP